MVDREARCIALEQAYVHEVYEEMGAGLDQPPWPRVTHFLNQLEMGAIVCDVGCGSGKYLSVNPFAFNIGVDRCARLVEAASMEQNEVLLCDNLSLPFKDESFDAVLSTAVVHHFATSERRIGAIKELARVLKIGGRLVITVWAMEQRRRKFESQDVLVPWHRSQNLSAHSLEITPTTASSEEEQTYHHSSQTSRSRKHDSGQSIRDNSSRSSRCKKKEVVPSPSSSSLSSPNETCYSFVRRALKKLAGVKKSGGRNKPCFLDSWSSCTSSDLPPKRYDPEGCEDIEDLPIELRRLEDEQEAPGREVCPPPTTADRLSTHKSKSLSDIAITTLNRVVRSQSSVPTLGAEEAALDNDPEANTMLDHSNLRLVKQKKSIVDMDVHSEERDKAMDMKDMVKSLPEFKVTSYSGRRDVVKQSSMNEEFMSAERLREKARVQQNIQKQASLNDELICNRNKTLDSMKDVLFSTSTSKRFQLIKNGLTRKIKNSTTNIEKVAGIKNGFVRILQGLTNTEMTIPLPDPHQLPASEFQNKMEQVERSHSREDGSDSSKDSSLQSDTSVDSEDSFASVIFVPKCEHIESTKTSPTLQSSPGSPQPTSPKIKLPPSIVSPKMRSFSMGISSLPTSPKLKHAMAVISTTQTPTSPKLVCYPKPNSPRLYHQASFPMSSPVTTTSGNRVPIKMISQETVYPQSAPPNSSAKTFHTYLPHITSKSFEQKITKNDYFTQLDTISKKEDECAKKDEEKGELLPESELPESSNFPDKSVTLITTNEIATNEKTRVVCDFIAPSGSSSMKAQFPLLRRSAGMFGRRSPVSKSVPRLFSLEIFNPETDDMDSDSSGLSSPDSTSSVISIKNGEESPEGEEVDLDDKTEKECLKRTSGVGAELSPDTVSTDNPEILLDLTETSTEDTPPSCGTRLSPLLEAVAGVATTLEHTVDKVIQSNPYAKGRQLSLMGNSSVHDKLIIKKSLWDEKSGDLNDKKAQAKNVTAQEPPSTMRWDEECRQHLAEFAEKLSENLLAEIDRYWEERGTAVVCGSSLGAATPVLPNLPKEDPYLFRLSEELDNLTRLSLALQTQSQQRFKGIGKSLDIDSMEATTEGHSSCANSCKSAILEASKIWTEDAITTEPSTTENLRKLSIPTELSDPEPIQRLPTSTPFFESIDPVDISEKALGMASEDVHSLHGVETVEFPNSSSVSSMKPGQSTDSSESGEYTESTKDSRPQTSLNASQHCLPHVSNLRPTNSLESSDAGDVSERTCSDISVQNTGSAIKTPSTTSFASDKASDCSKDARYADRRMARCDGRSSSEEMPADRTSMNKLVRQRASTQEPEMLTKTQSLETSLSCSTSQDSLLSDNGGGAITFHRYYHVFKEGELDQLIETYVDNLHIISSYYDHANWCVVAEKVQVWTI
ncbi:class I SAM-dependent methyltransferase fire dancer isoform X2 [Rhodnius prolixus]|uniref:class I SAM-dependent methyltransferase fire dancer isoform X2 n=1 Tax=Rhodnius prolixus TaxID=13249 RepID=UPI003D18C2F5